MGIYTVNVSIKPTFTLAIFKKDRNFFHSFILYLNVSVNSKSSPVHSSDLPNSTYNRHVPRKWMGSAITAITFPYFFD